MIAFMLSLIPIFPLFFLTMVLLLLPVFLIFIQVPRNTHPKVTEFFQVDKLVEAINSTSKSDSYRKKAIEAVHKIATWFDFANPHHDDSKPLRLEVCPNIPVRVVPNHTLKQRQEIPDGLLTDVYGTYDVSRGKTLNIMCSSSDELSLPGVMLSQSVIQEMVRKGEATYFLAIAGNGIDVFKKVYLLVPLETRTKYFIDFGKGQCQPITKRYADRLILQGKEMSSMTKTRFQCAGITGFLLQPDVERPDWGGSSSKNFTTWFQKQFETESDIDAYLMSLELLFDSVKFCTSYAGE